MVTTRNPNKRAKGEAQRANHEGSVYFRKSDQRWCAALSVATADETKKRRAVRACKKDNNNKTAAKAMLVEMKRELIGKGTIITSTQTVEVWLHKWFNTIASRKNRPKTQQSWDSIIRNHIVPSIGNVKLSALAPKHIRKMEADILAKGLRPTAITAYAILSRSIEYAYREGLITSKVTDKTDPPVSVRAKLVKLTVNDALKVIEVVTEDRLGSLRAANLLTGARQGELLGLELDRILRVVLPDKTIGTLVDLSWQLQRISWTHGCVGPDGVNAKGKPVKACGFKNAASCPPRKIVCPPDWEYRQLTNGMLLSRPKSSAGTRIVPLVEPLLSIVERRLRAVSQEINPHSLVWTADPKKDRHGRLQPLDGAPIDPSWDNEHWHDCLERAEVPQARLHAARHSTASLMRKAGVSTETITRILGHSTAAMSEKYIDYEVEQLVEAMTQTSATLMLPQLEGQA